jgi:hypothetical protein
MFHAFPVSAYRATGMKISYKVGTGFSRHISLYSYVELLMAIANKRVLFVYSEE